MATEAEEAPEPGVSVETLDEKMKIEQSVDELFEEVDRHKNEEREKSRSPREKDEMRRSMEMAKRLDGLPVRSQDGAKNEEDAVQEREMDEELFAEELNEKKMTMEEKRVELS